MYPELLSCLSERVFFVGFFYAENFVILHSMFILSREMFREVIQIFGIIDAGEVLYVSLI